MRKTIYVCDYCGVGVSEHKVPGWISIESDTDVTLQISVTNSAHPNLSLGTRFLDIGNKEFCSYFCFCNFFERKINVYSV